MKLRLSVRDETRGPGLVHLTVTEKVRVGAGWRKKGDALCRPQSSLPNLDVLDRQTFEERRCCEQCIDVMRRLRVHEHIELPSACGRVAGDLIRDLGAQREAAKVRSRVRKGARAVATPLAGRQVRHQGPRPGREEED